MTKGTRSDVPAPEALDLARMRRDAKLVTDDGHEVLSTLSHGNLCAGAAPTS